MIRRARVDDAEALGLLHVRSWQVGYRGVLDSEFLDGLDVQARVKWFRRVIAIDTPVLVADVHGGPVGFSMVGEARADDDAWGEIFSIYVDPDSWGQGHGHRLMISAEASMRDQGFDRALLWVVESNTRARDFYERQGWVLGRPIRLEEIGGSQVTEVRYERDLRVDV